MAPVLFIQSDVETRDNVLANPFDMETKKYITRPVTGTG